jgi:hypothetical protein
MSSFTNKLLSHYSHRLLASAALLACVLSFMAASAAQARAGRLRVWKTPSQLRLKPELSGSIIRRRAHAEIHTIIHPSSVSKQERIQPSRVNPLMMRPPLSRAAPAMNSGPIAPQLGACRPGSASLLARAPVSKEATKHSRSPFRRTVRMKANSWSIRLLQAAFGPD